MRKHEKSKIAKAAFEKATINVEYSCLIQYKKYPKFKEMSDLNIYEEYVFKICGSIGDSEEYAMATITFLELNDFNGSLLSEDYEVEIYEKFSNEEKFKAERIFDDFWPNND